MRASTTATFVLLFFVSTVAQPLQDDWDAVKALSAGTTVRIQQSGGRQVEGPVVSVDDAAIAILASGKTFSFDRQSVQQIDRLLRPVSKRAGLGLLIGASGGAVLGYSTAETNRGLWTALMAAGWGAVGALIGAVDGLRAHDYRLVYHETCSPAY
jgi:hypothetical protein